MRIARWMENVGLRVIQISVSVSRKLKMIKLILSKIWKSIWISALIVIFLWIFITLTATYTGCLDMHVITFSPDEMLGSFFILGVAVGTGYIFVLPVIILLTGIITFVKYRR